jgi:hypothetical protein
MYEGTRNPTWRVVAGVVKFLARDNVVDWGSGAR